MHPLSCGTHNNFISILHLTELIIFASYLLALISYCLKPPRYILQGHSWKTIWLATYAFCRGLNDRWSLSWPFYFVAVSFIVSMPYTPSVWSGSILAACSYEVLLVCLFLHLIQLLLPHAPSPVFFMPHSRVLLLSTSLLTLISSIILPGVLFFIPVLIVLFFLLSSSIADDPVWILSTLSPDIRPLIAKAYFFTFLLFTLVLLIWFMMFVTCLSSVTDVPASTLAWDTFGMRYGLFSRQQLLGPTVRYATPYYFPSPLNILELLLITVPCRVLRLLGKGRLAVRFGEVIKPALWSVAVMPLAFIVGIVYRCIVFIVPVS